MRMKHETERLLEETKRRLFESDEFLVNREMYTCAQPSHTTLDLDTLLERVDNFAPSARLWADSFDWEASNARFAEWVRTDEAREAFMNTEMETCAENDAFREVTHDECHKQFTI